MIEVTKNRLPATKLFFLICFSFQLLPSCEERKTTNDQHSPESKESDLYEVSYELSEVQLVLLGRFVEFYSSSTYTYTVDDLLGIAGIGYVSLSDPEDVEICEGRMEGDQLVVNGDEFAHLKVRKFLDEYFHEEMIEKLFARTKEIYRENGIKHGD